MFITFNRKNILYILLSLFIILLFTFICKQYILATKGTNWGLSFPKTPNETPYGNVTEEYLEKYNAYFLDKNKTKKIYLTFDAGYEAGYMPKILETLKRHNVKVTFFVVGSLIKSNPNLIKEIVKNGHTIGNHSMTHPNMSKMSTMDDFKKEILPVEKLYKEATGKEMTKFYRPPQGIYNEKNLQMAKELGYNTFFWSLAYVDWLKDKQPNPDESINKLLKRVHNGAIILLHSTSKTNSIILDKLIYELKNNGYTFGTLDELIKK